MPAAWYTVHLDSPSAGVLGDTAATLTAGGLSVDADYDPDADGTATIYADSATDAIRLALTGAVTVNLSAVNLPATEYAFSLGTSTLTLADHLPFLLTKLAPTSPPPPPPSDDPNNTDITSVVVTDPDLGGWRINLEDLAAHTSVSDWDYNDFYWDVTVGVDTTTPLPATAYIEAESEVFYTQADSSTAVVFTLWRESGPITESLSVTYEARLGEASSPFTSGSATIPAGQDSTTITVVVPPSTAEEPTPQSLFVSLTDPKHLDPIAGTKRWAEAWLVPAGFGIPGGNPGDAPALTREQKDLLFGMGNDKPDPSGKINNTALPKQGPLDDCWFVTAAISAARTDPDEIVKMFQFDTDTGKWTITPPRKGAKRITLEYDANFGGVSNDNGIWIQLLEQAFAKNDAFERLFAPGVEKKTGKATLDHFDTSVRAIPFLNAKQGSLTTAQLWAKPTTSILFNNSANGLKYLRLTLQTVNTGTHVILRSSEQPASDGMVPTHFYAAIGFKDDELELQNPHGKAGARGSIFKVKITDASFWNDFSHIGYGSPRKPK